MNAFFSSWTWKMAWRDARANKGRLLIYVSAIIIGVAAQVAITSFRDNVERTVDGQAQQLLGADLEVESNKPITDEVQAYYDSLGGEQSQVLQFASMAYFPQSGGTRLSNVRALRGGFPFYGKLVTQPSGAVEAVRSGNEALIDESLANQFKAGVGDTIRVGRAALRIAGIIKKVPGEAAAVSLIGPRIFIAYSVAEQGNLIQPGSRVDYKTYFKFEPGRDMAAFEEAFRPFARSNRLRFDTVRERKEEIGEVVANLSKFLNLTGFIALLLGGIGVASAITIYIKRKVDTAAILRCMGASGRQAMAIFTLQALVLGFLGALTGVAIGLAVQFALPYVLANFLPVAVSIQLSWPSIFLGLLTGTGVALTFALLPLLALVKTSPLYTLRTFNSDITRMLASRTRGIVYGIIALSITIYAMLLTRDWFTGLLFSLGFIAAIGLLYSVAQGLMALIQRFFPTSWPYVWRQGLANLYRPNNQTTVLLVSLGLGVLLISTLFFSQQLLLQELQFASREDAPNLIFFDIQTDQNEGVSDIIKQNEAPILQNVPMVTMRIDSLKGLSRDSLRNDSTRQERGWALGREYRVTYRDSLLNSETLTDGEWIGQAPDSGAVPISIAGQIRDDLHLSLGDSITFDVQGIPITTYVQSFREVDFQRVQPNFFVLFPTGVLEAAPKIFVTVTRAATPALSAQIQQQVVEQYPNVSAIDVRQILSTIQSFLDKISFAIQFMALLSILTGLIVLISAILVSRFQRIRETALLRTLGAVKRQIIQISGIEYVFIGLLAAVTGLLLSVITMVILGYFYFDVSFVPNGIMLLLLMGGATLLTLIVGLLSSADVYSKPPLEILRLEER